MEVALTKTQDGYKVTVTKNVPQVEEQVFATLDEAVAKFREVEAAPVA